MKEIIKKIPGSISVYNFLQKNTKYLQYSAEFKRFKTLQKAEDHRFDLLKWEDRYSVLSDKTATTSFDAHYIYHPAWAARIIAQTRPSLHIDVSSTLNFCAIVSAFVPVEFYDYRPAQLSLNNLKSNHGDLMHLPFDKVSVESLSCMHVVEHIGLGRYGDPLDPKGDLKAIAELKRVLALGGNLLFVTPVGKPTIRFNAHRIYSYDQIVSYFSDLQLQQFALVDDAGKFTVSADPKYANQQTYGCGCWWFKK